MIDKNILRDVVEKTLEGSAFYLVDLTVSPANAIVVEIDGDEGVDIEACAALTRSIEAAFNRDAEDYELEVGSAGITSPLKVIRQYARNIGNDMEVLTRDGRKLHGTLTEACESDGDISFTIEIPAKVKEPGKKKPEIRMIPEKLLASQCKYVCYDLKF